MWHILLQREGKTVNPLNNNHEAQFRNMAYKVGSLDIGQKPTKVQVHKPQTQQPYIQHGNRLRSHSGGYGG